MTRSLSTAGARHGIKVNLIAPAATTRMAGQADGRPIPRRCRPEQVAPMVAFLAHEDCPVSGEIYAAGAGRFARIFIASTEGYVHAGRRADDRGRRRATGRRSTTRPATPCPTDLMDWSAGFTEHLYPLTARAVGNPINRSQRPTRHETTRRRARRGPAHPLAGGLRGRLSRWVGRDVDRSGARRGPGQRHRAGRSRSSRTATTSAPSAPPRSRSVSTCTSGWPRRRTAT